jgi:hypothetical protein
MTRNTGVEEGNVGGGIDMAEVNRNPPYSSFVNSLAILLSVDR